MKLCAQVSVVFSWSWQWKARTVGTTPAHHDFIFLGCRNMLTHLITPIITGSVWQKRNGWRKEAILLYILTEF